MDAPGWYDRWFYGRSAVRQVRDATFTFSGIHPTRTSRFYAIEKTTPTSRDHMLQRSRDAGRADAIALLRRLSPVAARLERVGA